MRTLVLLAFVGTVIPFQSQSKSRGQVYAEGSSKQSKSVYLAGDVILGGLFPVHQRRVSEF